jgi:hypothetical protein
MKKNAHTVLLVIPQDKTKLGRPRRRWENNIKKYLEEIKWSVVEWVAAAQNIVIRRVGVDKAMNLYIP